MLLLGCFARCSLLLLGCCYAITSGCFECFLDIKKMFWVLVKTQYVVAKFSGWSVEDCNVIARVFWVVARELLCQPHYSVLSV